MKKLGIVLMIILLLVGIYAFGFAEETKSLPEVISEEKVLEIPSEEGVSYGVVSYYGERWNGRTTANMEIYDHRLLTCASPTLPFNTIIEITNIDNCKTVIVRVNDRGPFKMDEYGRALRPLIPHPVRVFDLSTESFKSIGDLKLGLLNIEYKLLGNEKENSSLNN